MRCLEKLLTLSNMTKMPINKFLSRAVKARKQIRDARRRDFSLPDDVTYIQDSASSSEEQKEKQFWKEVALALSVDQEPHETDPTETLAAKY